jgi:hypothetical protein
VVNKFLLVVHARELLDRRLNRSVVSFVSMGMLKEKVSERECENTVG